MTQLQHAIDTRARCKHCGSLAIAPCARCHGPVCGDCCVLTEHGATTYAICLSCNETGGNSLRAGWLRVASWIAAPIVLLSALLAILGWVFRK